MKNNEREITDIDLSFISYLIGVKFIIDYEGTSAINIDDLNIDVCINDCYEDNEDIISELNRIIALVEEEIEKTSTDENVCIGELNSGITSITKDCIIEHPENGNMGPAVLRSILEKMNYVVSELLTCNEFENCEQKLESINLNYKINVSQNKAEIIEKYHSGELKDEDHFYNLRWMEKTVLLKSV